MTTLGFLAAALISFLCGWVIGANLTRQNIYFDLFADYEHTRRMTLYRPGGEIVVLKTREDWANENGTALNRPVSNGGQP